MDVNKGTRMLSRRSFVGSAAGLLLFQRLSQSSEFRDDLPIDESITKSFDTALAVLKPSKSELERGLELHRNSLVWVIYGFSPRAALEPVGLQKMIDAGASDAELEDRREEMSMTRYVDDPREQAFYRSAWEAAGVTCVFQNAGEEGQDPLRLMKRLARFTYCTDMMRDFVSKAVTPDDIMQSKKANRHCLYFTGNGVPLPQRWVSVEDELAYIRLFFQLGIRMMHVTYNRRNMLGDGCAETANGGLSDLGRAAIAEMNRVGIIIDVAHSGWQTSLEAAKASQQPIVASHTGCDAIHHHIRCKPDDVIRAIVDKGGLMGICCISGFLGGGISSFLDHIDYMTKKFGVEHVAIGSDVAYSAPALPGKITRPASRIRTRYESLWPEGSLATIPADQQTLSWTNWPLFTVGLVQRGYREKEIQQILGGNMVRVAQTVYRTRKQGA